MDRQSFFLLGVVSLSLASMLFLKARDELDDRHSGEKRFAWSAIFMCVTIGVASMVTAIVGEPI